MGNRNTSSNNQEIRSSQTAEAFVRRSRPTITPPSHPSPLLNRSPANYDERYPNVVRAPAQRELAYHMPCPPNPSELSFNCPFCDKKCFDGGISRKLQCECGRGLLRRENDELQVVEGRIAIKNFDDNFNVKVYSPTNPNIPVLSYISLGVFSESVPQEYLLALSNQIDFHQLVNNCLFPFFLARERCIGYNDFFLCEGIKFKVSGASPSYGIVNETTSIVCQQELSQREIHRLQIGSFDYNPITNDHFNRIIRPHFQGRVRHIQADQYVYNPNLQFSVIIAEPQDGIVTSNTEIFIDNRQFPALRGLVLSAYHDTLPSRMQSMSQAQIGNELRNNYLLPYFRGWNRTIFPEKGLNIHGIQFRLNDNSTIGYVGDFTDIQMDSQTINREEEQRRVLFSSIARHPIFIGGRGQEFFQSTDEEMMLIHQFMQLTQMMNQSSNVEANRAQPNVVESLPTRNLTAISADSEQKDCMVCIEAFSIGEEVRTLPCFHFFHKGCIDEWLARSKLCPICKNNVESAFGTLG